MKLLNVRLQSFRQFIATGIAVIMSTAALGVSAPAEAARIYSSLPFAIFVCPIKSTPNQIFGSGGASNTRDLTNKTSYPDSNTLAFSGTQNGVYYGNKNIASTTKRSSDACIFLHAGHITRQRSESINWTDATQINVRLANSPSANNYGGSDDRCIFKLQSRKEKTTLGMTLHFSGIERDFQGGNWVTLEMSGGMILGTLNADGQKFETKGNSWNLECPDMKS